MDGGLLPSPAAGMLRDILEIFVRLVTGVAVSVFSFCFVASCSKNENAEKRLE